MDNKYVDLVVMALNHPNGLEILKELRQLQQSPTPELEQDPILKMRVYNIAKDQGVRTPRHINNMNNSELQAFIEQYSAW